MATAVNIIENRLKQLETENKELKVLNEDLALKVSVYEEKSKCYTKEQACLLFKIEQVKQCLNNMNIKKSGRNNFNKYSYYELEDINKPITDALISKGLASLFTFKGECAYLQIIDSESGAWIQWQTPLRKSERYMKQFSTFDKKGDVGDLMKDEQALQTYARRTLYLQALEIAETNVIEADKMETKKKPAFELPDNDIFRSIQNDFNKANVEINRQTVTNKLKSMLKNGRIDEEQYNKCIIKIGGQ